MRGGWLRSPIVHWMVIGGLLFACREAWRTPDGTPTSRVERAPVVISAQRITQLQADFAQRWGAPPTREQLQALIQHAIDDEVLYREARVLRLDLQDRSVRLRLIQKMHALGADPRRSDEELYREAVALGLADDVVIQRLLRQKMRLLLQQAPQEPPLQEQDIREYLERHRDRFLQPATVTFSQIFLSGRARGDRLTAQAEATLADLRARPLPPEATAALSDPFPLGRQLRAQSRPGIARAFGAAFAEQVFALEPRTWSGPLASPFGLHLVWVHEQTPERLPPPEVVRQQVGPAVLEARAAARLAHGLQRLRQRYEVRVESPAGDTSPPAISRTRTP
jgi:hypothetical protein